MNASSVERRGEPAAGTPGARSLRSAVEFAGRMPRTVCAPALSSFHGMGGGALGRVAETTSTGSSVLAVPQAELARVGIFGEPPAPAEGWPHRRETSRAEIGQRLGPGLRSATTWARPGPAVRQPLTSLPNKAVGSEASRPASLSSAPRPPGHSPTIGLIRPVRHVLGCGDRASTTAPGCAMVARSSADTRFDAVGWNPRLEVARVGSSATRGALDQVWALRKASDGVKRFGSR